VGYLDFEAAVTTALRFIDKLLAYPGSDLGICALLLASVSSFRSLPRAQR